MWVESSVSKVVASKEAVPVDAIKINSTVTCDFRCGCCCCAAKQSMRSAGSSGLSRFEQHSDLVLFIPFVTGIEVKSHVDFSHLIRIIDQPNVHADTILVDVTCDHFVGMPEGVGLDGCCWRAAAKDSGQE